MMIRFVDSGLTLNGLSQLESKDVAIQQQIDHLMKRVDYGFSGVRVVIYTHDY